MRGLAVAILAGALAGFLTGGRTQAGDDRSTELVRLDCATDRGRRETTLFANGTVRLRQRAEGGEEMALAELGKEELAGIVGRLEAIDLESEEGGTDPSGLIGPGVERCTLVVALPGRPPVGRTFGRFDTLSPALAQIVALTGDLGERAERTGPLRAGVGLPEGYEARPGDVLERTDGVLFEVVADTTDGRGVELRGVDQPLTVFVGKDQLAQLFVRRLEERRR